MDNSERGKKSRETGDQGELLVPPVLHRWGWIPRTDQIDYGEDLNVEVPASSGRPHERFLVQIKTSADQKAARDGAWKVPVDAAALARYRTSRHPVFLIAVNLSNREFRWLDLSLALERMQEASLGRNLRFHVPSANRFDETQLGGFDVAVLAAFERHSARFSSPVAALAYREQQLQAKDLRFAIRGAIADGKITYSIAARETVPLKARIQLREKEDAQALEQFFKFGLPAQIHPAEFSVTGSPLFEALSSSPSVVTFSPMGPPKRIVVGFRSADDRFEWALDEEAQVTRGQHGIAVQLNNPVLPLHLTLRADYHEKLLHISFNVKMSRWKGCNVRSLPFLEPVRQLLNGAISVGNLAVAARIHGVLSPPAEFPLEIETAPEAFEVLDSARRDFNTVACLMRVCDWAKSNVPWRDDDPAEEEIDGWIRAAEMLDKPSIDVSVERCGFVLPESCDYSELLNEQSILEFQLRTTFPVRAWHEVVAEIPIVITLRGYAVEQNQEGVPCAFTTQPGSSASLSLDREAPRPTEWTSAAFLGLAEIAVDSPANDGSLEGS